MAPRSKVKHSTTELPICIYVNKELTFSLIYLIISVNFGNTISESDTSGLGKTLSSFTCGRKPLVASM